MATIQDLPEIRRIVGEARMAQRSQGFVQWEDGYPGEGTLRGDIVCGAARILSDGGAVAGYAALVVSDPGYASTGDVWRVGGGYAVIHRLALSDACRGRGLGAAFLGLIEAEARRAGIGALRVDTGVENVVMQHLLNRCGYREVGMVTFPWGPRLAYEKNLT